MLQVGQQDRLDLLSERLGPAQPPQGGLVIDLHPPEHSEGGCRAWLGSRLEAPAGALEDASEGREEPTVAVAELLAAAGAVVQFR